MDDSSKKKKPSIQGFLDFLGSKNNKIPGDAKGKAYEGLGETILKKISGELSNLPFIVFGPFEAQVYKINDKYRMRMVIKCRLNKQTRELFHQLLCEFSPTRNVSLSVDFNPLTV